VVVLSHVVVVVVVVDVVVDRTDLSWNPCLYESFLFPPSSIE
jgi:hypothetical protein